MEDKNGMELIYDWNIVDKPSRSHAKVEFDDETLRDGLQSPNVITPSIEDKLKILHLMEDLGIDCADIGLPGAGKKHKDDAMALAKEIRDNKMNIIPDCAARTVIADVEPVADIAQAAGIQVEVSLFIGSSPIRQYTEGWTLEQMLKNTEEAVRFAKKNGLDIMFVTEDTTRSHPETVRALYQCAILNGVKRICVCDTTGHVVPYGVKKLIKFVKNVVKETNVKGVKIDWHGHNDRGLSIINSMSAIEAGANRIHGTALGVGERSGNTPMDLLLVNLKLQGIIDTPLHKLPEYCRVVSDAYGIAIPPGYPVFGKGAFETATGVHASAVLKALKRKDNWLADRVYSGVPAGDFGLEQIIRVGPMSGRSNIIYWLEKNGIAVSDELVNKIFEYAKNSKTILTDAELINLCK